MPRSLIDSLVAGGPAFVAADAVAKATILLCAATVLAAALRRSAAAVRHRLWSLALCGLIVVPPLSWSLPGWRLPILPSTTPDREVSAGSPADVPSTQPGLDHPRTTPAPMSQPFPAAHPVAITSVPRPSSWIAAVWALGVIAAASPVLAGVVGNALRRRGSRRVVDEDWLRLFDGLTRQLGLRRRVELRTTPAPLIPVTWGVLRPVVLLPERAREWPESVRRLVLLHELVHIKRWDVGFQLIGRFATAVYWFHPLAWYALRRLRAECECACDDHVVHAGARRSDYAQQLVDLARSLRPSGLAAVPMTRRNTLERRIRAMFDEGRNHQPLGRRAAGALLACGLVVTAGLAAVHPGPSAAGQQPPTSNTAAKDAAQPKEKPAMPDGSIHDVYTHPITVTGRAVDLAGKPIASARVYLASLRGDYKRVAETTTDAEGRYAFRDAPLPIERSNTVWGRDTGLFQVFGKAEGFGFAWRPQKWFHPQPKPANVTHIPGNQDPPESYEANDKIALDLRFPPPSHLSGTIVDDRGNPIPDVRLEIRECESLNVVNVIPGWTLDALNQRDTVPPSIKIRTTDSQGRFDFSGLPVDCRFRIDFGVHGFPERLFFAATTDVFQPDYHGIPVFSGEIKVVCATSLPVQVEMTFGDTGAPAPGVAVQAVNVPDAAAAARTHLAVLETTDDKGWATLRLPRGKYRMENWPARGTPYIVTEGELVVGDFPPDAPVRFRLNRAGAVEITVVDAETGAGIPDVDVWRRDADGQQERLIVRSWEVATRIVRRDSPRTDAEGKLRALVEPGKHRIGVGRESYPRGQKVVEADGQDVECRAGETVHLKFTMRKR